VAHSSSEAEYMATAHAARDLTRLTQLAQESQIPLRATATDTGPLALSSRTQELRVDNKGAIDMALANGPTERIKHIDVKHLYIQQHISDNILKLVKIPSSDQKADIFTKSLPRVEFLHNVSQLNLQHTPTAIEGGC
jgi:hypothetical protein